MAQPLFSAGQRVSIGNSDRFTAPRGEYRVVRVLPQEGGPLHYRVKSDGEAFERIVAESRLMAVRFD